MHAEMHRDKPKGGEKRYQIYIMYTRVYVMI